MDALAARGLDPAPVLSAAGFAEDAFRDPNARHSIAVTARLWHLAAAHAGDPAFGLQVAKHARLTSFHALGYAVIASATLGEALDRAVRYCELVVDAGTLELEHVGEESILRIMTRAGYESGGIELRDALLSMIVRSMRKLSGGAFVLSRVEIRRPPTANLAAYQRFFACPVTLAEHDALHFDRALLSAPLVAANADLARFNEGAAREYLRSMSAQTVVDRVREAIMERLPSDVSPELIARKLGMSLRSMQRSLRERETSYEDVLRELRLELAQAHLRAGRYSNAEIAFLLGYESPSAFSRAFRRWTGRSPSEFAQRRPPHS
ncbi:MAG: AraC family transcriptional regulator [Myxococcales bacterium]